MGFGASQMFVGLLYCCLLCFAVGPIVLSSNLQKFCPKCFWLLIVAFFVWTKLCHCNDDYHRPPALPWLGTYPAKVRVGLYGSGCAISNCGSPLVGLLWIWGLKVISSRVRRPIHVRIRANPRAHAYIHTWLRPHRVTGIECRLCCSKARKRINRWAVDRMQSPCIVFWWSQSLLPPMGRSFEERPIRIDACTRIQNDDVTSRDRIKKCAHGERRNDCYLRVFDYHGQNTSVTETRK